MLSMQELLVVVVIGLVVFKWRKLPEIGGGIGKAMSNFKRSLSEPEEIDLSEQGKKKDSDQTPPKP